MRIKSLLFLLILTCSCTTNKSIVKSTHIPQEQTNKILKMEIISMSKHFKTQNYEVLPYLYYNKQGDYNKIKGDYFSLRHPKYEEVNLLVGFWKNYGNSENILKAQVWVKSNTKSTFNKLDIEVASLKHGKMLVTPMNRNTHRSKKSNKELSFVIKLSINNNQQLVDKISGDAITITVDGYKYTMLNPFIKTN